MSLLVGLTPFAFPNTERLALAQPSLARVLQSARISFEGSEALDYQPGTETIQETTG